MISLLPLVALIEAAAHGAPVTLAVAEPQDVAAAVKDCVELVRDESRDEQNLLAAKGWQIAHRPSPVITVHRRDDSRAVIMTGGGFMSRTCFVRARLSDRPMVAKVTGLLGRYLGSAGRGKLGDGRSTLWRNGSLLVALENFDDGPASPRNVIQIAVGRSPLPTKET